LASCAEPGPAFTELSIVRVATVAVGGIALAALILTLKRDAETKHALEAVCALCQEAKVEGHVDADVDFQDAYLDGGADVFAAAVLVDKTWNGDNRTNS
jgi:hypothetical protein